MEFIAAFRRALHYSAPKNKQKGHKHDLRQHFHKQLKTLWNLPAMETANKSLV